MYVLFAQIIVVFEPESCSRFADNPGRYPTQSNPKNVARAPNDIN